MTRFEYYQSLERHPFYAKIIDDLSHQSRRFIVGLLLQAENTPSDDFIKMIRKIGYSKNQEWTVKTWACIDEILSVVDSMQRRGLNEQTKAPEKRELLRSEVEGSREN